MCVRICRAEGVCGSRIKKEKGVEKRRGRLCEGMVGQARQKRERGTCVCVGGKVGQKEGRGVFVVAR